MCTPTQWMHRDHPRAADIDAPVDKVVFVVAMAITVGFVLWGVISPTHSDHIHMVLGWIIDGTGWIYVLATTGFVALMLMLALSRYGRIRLGRDDERPEFSTGSWISMMFATGMGIGLIFWGVAEPLSHLLTPPMDMAEPGSPEAAALGLQYTIFHWGMHPWALYGVVGLALAYATFRKGRPNLLSSIVFPKKDPRHPARRAVDIFGLFITTFGAATSLGLGALQINSGLTRVFGAPKSDLVAIIAIAVLTAAFVVSAVSGTERGIKWLANTNAGLAVALLVFVFILGPTIFLLNDFTETIGGYLSQFIPMSFRTGALGGGEWLAAWTIFYWAWWMSWAPFVGVFMARISRGRTIRQFVVCVLIVPTLVSMIWFVVMGGTAIRLPDRRHGRHGRLPGQWRREHPVYSAGRPAAVHRHRRRRGDLDHALLCRGRRLGLPGARHAVPGRIPAPPDLADRDLGHDDRCRRHRPAARRRTIGDSNDRDHRRRPLPRWSWSASAISLMKQLRQEPVVSTVPPGVRTVVAETLHAHPVDQAPTNNHSVDTQSRTDEPSKADQPT